MSLLWTSKPPGVEQLFANARVERLYERVVSRLAWPREVELDLVRVGPLVKRLRSKLGALIATDRDWSAAALHDAGKDVNNGHCAEIRRHFERKAFARNNVDDRQNPGTVVADRPSSDRA